jgi:hypothetical protein
LLVSTVAMCLLVLPPLVGCTVCQENHSAIRDDGLHDDA